MNEPKRSFLPYLAVCALLLVAASAAVAGEWPAALDYSVGLSTSEDARIQTSASLSGPIGPHLGLKIGGWWIAGSDDNRAFVGDAYVDYDKQPIYLAAGRRFMPYGPAGILVSPGIYGGQFRLTYDRWSVEALSGQLAFTPVTGGTRFTFAGNRSPAEEHVTAGRVAVTLSDKPSATPVTVGVNALGLLDDTGRSADISIDATQWLNLFGETAEFNDVRASGYGIRLSDQKSRPDPSRYTMLVFFHRKVPIGFLPAQAGASAYFENQTGWVGGLYHQFNANRAVGVYADDQNAILTLFGHVPF